MDIRQQKEITVAMHLMLVVAVDLLIKVGVEVVLVLLVAQEHQVQQEQVVVELHQQSLAHP